MRFSRGKIWFVDIGPCKRFDIFQLRSEWVWHAKKPPGQITKEVEFDKTPPPPIFQNSHIFSFFFFNNVPKGTSCWREGKSPKGSFKVTFHFKFIVWQGPSVFLSHPKGWSPGFPDTANYFEFYVCVKSFMLFIDSFRSLGRSIDDTVSESGDFAISIEDDILGDIRTKIEAKIRNYETIIEVLIWCRYGAMIWWYAFFFSLYFNLWDIFGTFLKWK